MGQRLNIQIEHNGNIYANCYLHWDAYTRVALKDTKKILDFIGDRRYSVNSFDRKEAGEILRNSLPSSGYEYDSLKRYNLPDVFLGKSRNAGLISLTDKAIQATIDYEEGRVTIDPIDRFISFNVFSIDSVEGFYGNYNEEHTQEEINNFKEVDFDYQHIKFEDFYSFCEFLHQEIIDKPPVKYKDMILWEIW